MTLGSAKRIENHLVIIKDGEKSSVGVKITKDGYIVASYRSVSSMRAVEVKELGNTNVYKGINIVGLIPKYELALLKVVPKTRWEELPSQKSTQSGESCSIVSLKENLSSVKQETGIVSSHSRLIEGAKFIQISMEIKDNNYGGLLIGKEGKAVGIACFSAPGKDNISYAAPIDELNFQKFSRLDKVEVDEEKLDAVQRLAYSLENKLYRIRKSKLKQKVFSRCVELRNLAAIYSPNNPGSYEDLGRLYLEMNQTEEAKIYYRKSLLLNSNSLPSLAFVVRHERDKLGAEEFVNSCIKLIKSNKKYYTRIGVVGLMKYSEVKKSYYNALYYQKWAESISGRSANEQGEFSKIEIAAKKNLTIQQVSELHKRSFFEIKKNTMSKPKSNLLNSTSLQEHIELLSYLKKRRKHRKSIPLTGVNLNLPGPINSYKFGVLGGYIALEINKINHVLLVDSYTLKIVKFIPVRGLKNYRFKGEWLEIRSEDGLKLINTVTLAEVKSQERFTKLGKSIEIFSKGIGNKQVMGLQAKLDIVETDQRTKTRPRLVVKSIDQNVALSSVYIDYKTHRFFLNRSSLNSCMMSAYPGRIMYVGNEQISFWPVSLIADGIKEGKAIPGQVYEKQLQLKGEAKLNLAPPSMSLSNGRLIWSVPRSNKLESVYVVIIEEKTELGHNYKVERVQVWKN